MELLLKAKNAEALEKALLKSGAKVSEPVQIDDDTLEDQVRLADGVELDVIGVISKPTGAMTEATDDEPSYPVYADLDGYHANIRGVTAEMASKLSAVTVTEVPSVRFRVWG